VSALTFTVPGNPVAWGRARIKRTRCGRILLWTPEKTRRFEALVRELAAHAMREAHLEPLSSCVALAIVAAWKAPKRATGCVCPMGRHRPRRPDEDNVGKAISDALNGVAYRDDAQVVHKSVDKVLAAPGEPGYVQIAITSLHGEWS
jgi:Holliday junction resolvase RusA-like endonuclease